MYHFMTRSFRNSPTPSENRLIAFPIKPSPSRDSNPARSDRMPSLYHLRHHHCPIIDLLLDYQLLQRHWLGCVAKLDPLPPYLLIARILSEVRHKHHCQTGSIPKNKWPFENHIRGLDLSILESSFRTLRSHLTRSSKHKIATVPRNIFLPNVCISCLFRLKLHS